LHAEVTLLQSNQSINQSIKYNKSITSNQIKSIIHGINADKMWDLKLKINNINRLLTINLSALEVLFFAMMRYIN